MPILVPLLFSGYLCSAELLPNPCSATAWQQLYESHEDRAYIVTMGFYILCFDLILTSSFACRWDTRAIVRRDVAEKGTACPDQRSLDAAGVSRYTNFTLKILLETLRDMPSGQIKCLLDRAFGSLDGLNLPCQTSDDLEIENATYNGWLHEHFISSVLAFTLKGTIMAAKLNCPGSWHDSRVARPIYEKLYTKTPDGYFLVADTAFPHGSDQIAGRIRASIKAGQQLLSSVTELPLEIDHDEQRGDLLETCVRLNNVHANIIGINQINTAQIWDGFAGMLFAEQRCRDQVKAFHIVADS
ncbi:uncharacterized protein LAESUDRAFT_737563 [Laetiporus sulphureus 93-53]|uniref:DDE Tnp4 domain-containing protein n=1 Tax=Laetiporus sulphureus 93-53 TaxID=1314785 RepID=A0A165DRS5_9APHY|nr:uncharacterized protein LAESUDRAFT_737563 [Laetiporus sulphureus 93-53]KZT05494.1 hypothetical protein LAESUDRAFT_737563 [Laetiporus sulphureus 93-53]